MLRACAVALATLVMVSSAQAEDGWVTIFDGKTLDGWKVTAEHPESFKVEDGTIVANGERAHLFYVGEEKPFKNFELSADIKTDPNSNAGLYFHTKYQDTGWPKYGFEAQVNNSYNSDPKRTGSLYGVQNVDAAGNKAKDNEWFTMVVRVEGKHVTITVDGEKKVDYIEPDDHKAGADFTRKLDEGTFAIQAHDPKSRVSFKNLKVRRLD